MYLPSGCSGAAKNVTIALSLASGSGIANISLSWPIDFLGSPETSRNLKNLTTSLDYPQNLSILGNTASGSTGLIPSGAYLLTIALTDSAIQVAAPTRVGWVFPGVTTNADISLSDEELKAPPEAPSYVVLDDAGATTSNLSWTDNADVAYTFQRSPIFARFC